MGFYRPASDDHAIEQAMVGIRLFEPARDEVITTIDRRMADLKDQFPGRAALEPFPLALDRLAISPGFAKMNAPDIGFRHQKFAPDGGRVHELIISKTFISYQTSKYNRWSDIQEVLKTILIPLAEDLCEGDIKKIAVIELKCADTFICDETDGSPTPLSALVREDCSFVPRRLLSVDNFLHCHTGWFQDVNSAGRDLLAYNLDLGISSAGRFASILQTVSLQASESRVRFGSDGSLQTELSGHFETLHHKDKWLMSELLTDEVQKSINLHGTSGIKVF